MKIDIVERAPVRVAYFRYTGPFGESLGHFWRTTVAARLAEFGLIDCPRYGVTLDDPARTAPERCRYDACVELPPGLSLPGSPEATIAGGRYAITRFKGTSADIGAAWGAFMGELLSGSAHRLDDARPVFEHYPRGAVYEARTGMFTCQLCIPASGESR